MENSIPALIAIAFWAVVTLIYFIKLKRKK